MRRWVVASVLAVCVAAAWSAAEAEEFILSWDDGSAEDVVAPAAGKIVVAGFQVPSPSASLLGIQMYVCDDGVTNPSNPMLPTTAPFTMHTFAAASGGEGPGAAVGAAYVPCPDWYSYPEGMWLDWWFPSPRDIGDSALFPGGFFFVGVGWMHTGNPQTGVDLDAPGHPAYWLGESGAWSVYDTGDVLLRAMVSDTSGTAVIDASWGSVKWMFQEGQ